jgi:membrane associated rhomboid family serine protease
VKPPRAARVTGTIVALTVAAYAAQWLFGGPHLLLRAGFIPARVFEALPFTALPFVATPLSATLLHGGLLHLGLNMLMLVVSGRGVESVIGARRFVALYVAGAYGAALAQFLVDPYAVQPMIGASGAVSAVLGTYAMMFGRDETRSFGPLSANAVRALWLAAAWTLVQWGISFASAAGPFSIATAAHVGGFVTGLVLTSPLLQSRYRSA